CRPKGSWGPDRASEAGVRRVGVHAFTIASQLPLASASSSPNHPVWTICRLAPVRRASACATSTSTPTAVLISAAVAGARGADFAGSSSNRGSREGNYDQGARAVSMQTRIWDSASTSAGASARRTASSLALMAGGRDGRTDGAGGRQDVVL